MNKLWKALSRSGYSTLPFLLIFLVGSAGVPASAQTIRGDTIILSPQAPTTQFDPLAVFDEMIGVIEGTGVYGAADAWETIKRNGRIRAIGAENRAQVLDALNATLNELNLPGARVFSSNDPQYYYNLSFLGSGVFGLERVTGSGALQFPDVGFIWDRELLGNVVTTVLEGSTARSAGLKIGDSIVSVDGKPFAGLSDFKAKAGRTIQLSVTGPDGNRIISIVPNYIEPRTQLRNAMAASIRVITYKGMRFGYVHAWIIDNSSVQYLRNELSGGSLSGVNGMVMDLRGVFWAEPAEFLGLFSNVLNPKVEVRDRNGARAIWASAWEGPMAVLIDSWTRGFAEVYAYGVRKNNLAALVGTRTGGLLAEQGGFILSDGSLLVIPVGEILVDNLRMLGMGVEPEVSVEQGYGIEFASDPVLESALELLVTQ